MTKKQQEAMNAAMEALNYIRAVGEYGYTIQELVDNARRLLIEAGDGWEPLEKAPKDGRPLLFDNGGVFKWVDTSYEAEVLVSRKGKRSTYETQLVEDGYWDHYTPKDEFGFTKYMELPAPPKEPA